MYLRYTRTAAAVLCAVAAGSVPAADNLPSDSDLLDVIRVEIEALPPAMTPIVPARLSPGRESADALRDLIGVSGSRMGGHGTDVSIRGQSQTRINVLLDGAYVHGGCPNRMDPPTSYAHTGNYEEVMVIRGVQSLEFGGGGSGGSILFERITERFDGDEAVRGSVDAGYRGNHDTRELGVDVAAGSATLFGRFLGSYTDAGNYQDGDGNEVRSSYEERSGTVILGYTPSDATRAELSVERQETRNILFPGAGMDSPLADNDTVRFEYETEEVRGAFTHVKAEAYRSKVEHVMDNYSLRSHPPMMADMRAPSTSNTFGGRVVAGLASGYGQWKVGIDTQRNDRDAERFNDTTGILNSVLWPGVAIDQTGIFGELTHDLDDRNRVTGGLRYDYVTSEASSADVDPPGMPLSPNQLYAIYYNGAQATKQTDHNVGGLLRYERDLAGGNGTVYAGISRAVRTPDATERYIASHGMMPSQNWVGNPNIEPEKHHQVELGLQLRGGDWEADGSVFYNDVSDYILRDRFVDTANPANKAEIYRNIDATLIGGEVRLAYRWSANWRSELGVAYVRADNDTDNRAIAQTPPLEGIVSLDYSAGDWDAGARMRAAATQDRVDTLSLTGVDGDGLDFGTTSGWAVLDLYANYEVSDSVSIDFGLDNVLDHTYAQHLNREDPSSGDQLQVNEPGRSAWLKISALF